MDKDIIRSGGSTSLTRIDTVRVLLLRVEHFHSYVATIDSIGLHTMQWLVIAYQLNLCSLLI